MSPNCLPMEEFLRHTDDENATKSLGGEINVRVKIYVDGKFNKSLLTKKLNVANQNFRSSTDNALP